MSTTSNLVGNVWIERSFNKITGNPCFKVYQWRSYGRSSVLAGSTIKQQIVQAETLEGLRSQFSAAVAEFERVNGGVR